MKARIKPGPRPGWGRVDLDTDDDCEYTLKGMVLKTARIGRYQRPCLIFPLKGLRVGDVVEVTPTLKCRWCGMVCSSLINNVCDNCYGFQLCGDMVSPPLVAALTAAGEGEDNRP